jgi:hypothetical protein
MCLVGREFFIYRALSRMFVFDGYLLKRNASTFVCRNGHWYIDCDAASLRKGCTGSKAVLPRLVAGVDTQAKRA